MLDVREYGPKSWTNELVEHTRWLKKYSCNDLKRSRESLVFNLLSSLNFELHFMICTCSRCKIGSVI